MTQAASRAKIGVLIGNLEVGGAERDIVRNFPRLNRDEFEVVVVLFGHAGALAPELEREGIRYVARLGETIAAGQREPTLFGKLVHAIPESIKRPVKKALKAVFHWGPIRAAGRAVGSSIYIAGVTRWVGRTFKDEQIDLGHFFLPHSYAYGMFGCRFWRPNAKTVMSRLSLNFYRDSHRTLAWIERNVLHSRVDIAIGNSQLIIDELVQEGVPREHTRLLYNGIDLKPFVRRAGDRERVRASLGITEDAFVMVAVGNLYAYKGHRELIEACAEVKDALPNGWKLLIAGRDQEGNREAYGELIESSGLSEHVHLLGPREDVPELLLAADVFTQPSRHEGLPNAIVEAMAASLPVIATAVGGIPEALTGLTPDVGGPVETGWLVSQGDTAELARAVLEAAADPERRLRMGEAGRSRAEACFSLERSVADYEAIYRELLS